MQGYLELINMPYSTCDVLTSALTFDKFVLNRYLKSYGIRVPESILLRLEDSYDEKEIEQKWACLVSLSLQQTAVALEFQR